MTEHNQQQNLEAIIGPGAKYSDYKAGETIRFRQGDTEKTGVIIFVRAPGSTYPGGPIHPTIYLVDTDAGMPEVVAPGDVVE